MLLQSTSTEYKNKSIDELKKIVSQNRKILQNEDILRSEYWFLNDTIDKFYSCGKPKVPTECKLLHSIAIQELLILTPKIEELNKVAGRLERNYLDALITYKEKFSDFEYFLTMIKTNRQFTTEGMTKLYYIRLKHENKFYYKIGITKRSVLKRFSKSDAKKIDSIIFENYFSNAESLEQCILVHFEEYRTYDLEILFDGFSEIFDCDVLEIDKEI